MYLKTSLTVPEGVTLDLTADKVKFELQNGAKLTVDGTVNTSDHGGGEFVMKGGVPQTGGSVIFDAKSLGGKVVKNP
ncbi:hypothetical protein AGMMS49579_08780 [Spirochaetia bacterium]|nr:hypothetical protein AGMMS49579_08780 [Spirochaetia bacterium]